MNLSRPLTIRVIVDLLVAACLLPMSLMAVFIIIDSYGREQAQLKRDSIATARALIQTVDQELASVQSALTTLATSPYLASDNLAAFYAQAHEVLREQFANNIVLSDASGRQRVNTLRPFGDPLPMHGNPEQLRRVFETGRPVISGLYMGAVARRPLVGIDVPVRRGDAVVYSISMGIFPEHLAEILVRQRLPSGWVASIFDSTGTIVSRTHSIETYLGKKGSPALIQRIAQVAEDSLETDTVEGIPVLAVYSRSNVSNWAVAIGIPKSELNAQVWYSLRWIVLVMVLLIAGSAALASIVGARIRGAFHGLYEPALAIGNGELVEVPSLAVAEANEVGSAMTRASKLLRQAQYSAQHDPLTDLANRTLFDEIVKQQIALCERTATELAIVYIDLDGFKTVNDQHGHALGDALLRMAATRLKTGIRHSDLAARLGGDEFAVALPQTGGQDAAALAGKLVKRLSAPYQSGTLTVRVSASVGVAVYPGNAKTEESLLSMADKAMYEAKSLGGQRYVLAGSSQSVNV